MGELTQSTAAMLDAFTPALQKLSEIFCVSVDYLRANLMQAVMLLIQKGGF